MGVIVLVGRSCSGKTSTKDALCTKYGYGGVVTCTTRAPRPREVDGVHYIFMSRDEFTRKIAKGCFAEYAEYNGNLYGSLRKDFESGSTKVVILEPTGAKAVKESLGDKSLIVFLHVDEKTCIEAFRGRGVSEEEVQKRIKQDSTAFTGFEDFADVVIDNSGFKYSVSEVANLIDTAAKSVF